MRENAIETNTQAERNQIKDMKKRGCCAKFKESIKAYLGVPDIQQRKNKMKVDATNNQDQLLRHTATNQQLTDIIEGIFKALQTISDPHLKFYYNDKVESLEMPLTQDVYGETGLDIVLGYQPNKTLEKNERVEGGIGYEINRFMHTISKKGEELKQVTLFKLKPKDRIDSEENCLSATFAAKVFENIKDYGFMHSGYVIAGAIPTAVDNDVKGIWQFLESRFKKPVHCPAEMQPELIENVTKMGTVYGEGENENTFEVMEYGAVAFDPWVGHEQITSQLFKDKKKSGGALKAYQMSFFDIPYLHEFSKEGIDFMEALADYENNDSFDTKAITMIVKQRWAEAQPFYFFVVAWPFFLTIITCFIWTNFVAPFKETDIYYIIANYMCTFIMLAYSVFSLVIEGRQLFMETEKGKDLYGGLWRHFSDIVNVIESLNILTLALVAIVALAYDQLPTWFWAISSFTSLIIWLKLFFFCRAWEKISFFIIMLQKIFFEIYPFMKVLFVIIVAFASSFNFHSQYVKETGQIEENERAAQTCPDLIDGSKAFNSLGQACTVDTPKQIEGYLGSFGAALVFSYNLTLGEFNTDSNDFLGWILFIVASLFSQVVMLNLLVAIFSGVHDEIQDQKPKHQVKAFADLVWEIQSIKQFVKGTKPKEEVGQLLFFVTEKTIQENATVEEAQEELKQQDFLEDITQVQEVATEVQRSLEAYQIDSKATSNDIKKAVVNVAAKANKFFK